MPCIESLSSHKISLELVQPTAVEIMQQMTALQEAALERLYRWTQSQCRGNIEAAKEFVRATIHAHASLRPHCLF